MPIGQQTSSTTETSSQIESDDGSFIIKASDDDGIQASFDSGSTYYDVNTNNPAKERAGYTGGSPSTGMIGAMLSESGSVGVDEELTISALESYAMASLTLTPGVWMVSGNVTCDDDTIVGGWAKAQLRESADFSKNFACQISTDDANDFSIAPMTRHASTGEGTTVYLSYMHETERTAAWYYRIEAVRIA